MNTNEFATKIKQILDFSAARFEDQHQEHVEQAAADMAHFCEWNVTEAWTNTLVRTDLSHLARMLGGVETDQEVITVACQFMRTWLVRRVDLRLESSTSAVREANYRAKNDALAKLCSMFNFVLNNMAEHQPEIFAQCQEETLGRLTRSW